MHSTAFQDLPGSPAPGAAAAGPAPSRRCPHRAPPRPAPASRQSAGAACPACGWRSLARTREPVAVCPAACQGGGSRRPDKSRSWSSGRTHTSTPPCSLPLCPPHLHSRGTGRSRRPHSAISMRASKGALCPTTSGGAGWWPPEPLVTPPPAMKACSSGASWPKVGRLGSCKAWLLAPHTCSEQADVLLRPRMQQQHPTSDTRTHSQPLQGLPWQRQARWCAGTCAAGLSAAGRSSG